MNEETNAEICEGCLLFPNCQITNCHALRILDRLGYDISWGGIDILFKTKKGNIGRGSTPIKVEIKTKGVE